MLIHPLGIIRVNNKYCVSDLCLLTFKKEERKKITTRKRNEIACNNNF